MRLNIDNQYVGDVCYYDIETDYEDIVSSDSLVAVKKVPTQSRYILITTSGLRVVCSQLSMKQPTPSDDVDAYIDSIFILNSSMVNAIEQMNALQEKISSFEKKLSGYSIGGYLDKHDSEDIRARRALKESVPALAATVHCPERSCSYNDLGKMTLWNMIQHINDEHRWTRESIADWLETLDVDISINNKEK